MTIASLSTGNGPGSSIPLAPETIRVRNALIEKFNGAPLEEMSNFMTMALANETDELRRLGSEKNVEILSSSKSAITTQMEDVKLRIDRDTGTVRVKRGKHYAVIACSKSVFTM